MADFQGKVDFSNAERKETAVSHLHAQDAAEEAAVLCSMVIRASWSFVGEVSVML